MNLVAVAVGDYEYSKCSNLSCSKSDILPYLPLNVVWLFQHQSLMYRPILNAKFNANELMAMTEEQRSRMRAIEKTHTQDED